MQIVWYPKKWWNICMSDNEKKVTLLIYNMKVLKHFDSES